ncbi:MAG: hypothetical protein Q9169_007912 [Polycauliona sp. 2 TL-2023]
MARFMYLIPLNLPLFTLFSILITVSIYFATVKIKHYRQNARFETNYTHGRKLLDDENFQDLIDRSQKRLTFDEYPKIRRFASHLDNLVVDSSSVKKETKTAKTHANLGRHRSKLAEEEEAVEI